MTRSPGRPTVGVAALVCLAAFALAGCSERPDDPADRPAADESSVADSSASTAPATPSETTSTGTTASSDPEPTDGATAGGAGRAPGGLRGRLLAAADLPGFNQEFRWTQGRTRSREPRAPFGTCQRFAMTSIGASGVATRGYRPADPEAGDRAGELVAEFPDSTTARRAFAVLKSWRAQCAGRLKRFDRSHVGAFEDVPVAGGTGGWYLLTYGPVSGDPDSGYFDAQGMAVVGSRIAMVEMVLAGQDYDYAPGHEPMVDAVRRAAAELS